MLSLPALLSSGPVLTDGAWGTQFQMRGLAAGDFPDLWNLTNPQAVLEVARGYVEAGSRVILTNTFGANRIRLAEAGAEKDMAAINREGARISKEAAGSAASVFASIGPSGKMLMAGDVSAEELEAAFAEQAAALAEGGADALVIETMSDPEEAVIAVRAAKHTGLPVVASMVYDSGRDKDRTMMGTTPEQAAEVLAAAGADVIGANCGQGIEGFVPVCRRLKAVTGLPLWMKANAGMPELVGMETVYRTTPEEFAGFVRPLLGAGASFVGGCCGTSPAFVKAAAAILNSCASH